MWEDRLTRELGSGSERVKTREESKARETLELLGEVPWAKRRPRWSVRWVRRPRAAQTGSDWVGAEPPAAWGLPTFLLEGPGFWSPDLCLDLPAAAVVSGLLLIQLLKLQRGEFSE